MSARKEPFDPLREAVKQWSSHDLGAIEHMEATTAINRVHQIVVGRIDERLKKFQLTFAQYELLVLLHFSSSGSLFLNDMGHRLMVHPSTVTSTVDRLEGKKLVRRVPHPEDRRRIAAEITAKGRKVAVASSDALVEVKYGLEQMTTAEARTINKTLRSFRERIKDFPERSA